MNSPDSLRSPVKNARGLGSARSGVHHFIVQRATAVALLFLTVYLVVLLVSLIGADYSQARAAVGTSLVRCDAVTVPRQFSQVSLSMALT